MKIGCPKETKNNEFRVGLTPAAVKAYVNAGHQVFIQKGAGLGSGITDEEYQDSGAKILGTAQELWGIADVIGKVKEPMPQECALMREGQVVYAAFHFAADKELTRACLVKKIIAVAYETVRESDGSLPLLRPMSEIAGSVAPIMGGFYLSKVQGGEGLLVTGVSGVAPANVLVLGGGVVGSNAARIAAGMGAKVTILDINPNTLERLRATMPANVLPVYSDSSALQAGLPEADIIIGGVLVPGARTPQLVKREDLSIMKRGAVIVDIAIDQGGCFESSHPTTHSDPTFIEGGVVHYCVPNVPGVFSRTASFALNNRTIKYGLEIAAKGVVKACRDDNALKSGLNMYKGAITFEPVAKAHALEEYYKSVDEVIS